MTRARIAVLASGGGSNLQALIDYFEGLGDARAGDIVLVASDRPNAGALARATRADIPTAVLSSPRVPDGEDLGRLLGRRHVNLLVLAGYLQLVPGEITRLFAGRMLNVHPGPLPRFGGPGMYGARVHRAVIAAGVPFTGPTVHFVDEEYDHGAAIVHWPVPVRATDDDHSLAARVLRAEHILFPRVVQAVARRNTQADARAERVTGVVCDPALLQPFDPDLDDATLSGFLDAARDV